MKVLLVNGSPRAAGCTYTALTEVAKGLAEYEVESEVFQLGTKPVRGCIACRRCHTDKLARCVFDDEANRFLERAAACDALVLGSPVYCAGPNGSLCAMLDRAFFAGGHRLAYKPAAAVVSCRRGGSSAALDRLNKYFTVSNMPVVSSKYWNMVHGSTPEEVLRDEEGMQVMRTLGRNMGWMLRCFETAALAPPAPENPSARTNFIR